MQAYVDTNTTVQGREVYNRNSVKISQIVTPNPILIILEMSRDDYSIRIGLYISLPLWYIIWFFLVNAAVSQGLGVTISILKERPYE